jgi:hypothetical protein
MLGAWQIDCRCIAARVQNEVVGRGKDAGPEVHYRTAAFAGDSTPSAAFD